MKETLPKAAMEASITIEDGIRNQFNTLNVIASMDYMRALKDPDADIPALKTFLSNETGKLVHKQMILVDKNGKILYSNGTVPDIKGDPNFKNALAGNETVSEPMFDKNRSGIIMVYAVPVKLNGRVEGVLMAVRDGLELSEFAGRVKYGETGEAYIINKQGRTIAHGDKDLMVQILETAAYNSNSADTSGENTSDATSSATSDATSSATSADASSSATSGNTASPDVSEADGDNTDEAISVQSAPERGVAQKLGFEGFVDVQKNMMDGSTGFGEYKYNGIAKVTGYAPVESYGWSVALSVNKDEMLSGLREMQLTISGISILFLLAGLAAAYFLGKGISTPVVHLSNECNIMSSGDFSRVMDEKYTKRKDEIGDLARSFNNINVNVSKIIRNVIEESGNVGKAIENVNEHMVALTSEINFMSDVINKLSTKMDENSASAEEMNATSNEIEDAVDSIANDSQQTAATAGEVSMRAEKLKATAFESQKRAQQIQTDVAVKLREAIEESKAVENIKVLSDAILNISSRTNLLALNASIEASRAGNAGLGFSVVAEEIRGLAENSKETANEIQNVTKRVIESVHSLSESAEQVLEFLEDKVVKDYDMLVEAGEQYNNDARMINEMVTNLSAITQELYASIQTMVQAISDVAAASEEGASETGDLAEKAEDVVRRTGEVLAKTHDVNESADRLLQLVSIFKV